MTESNGELQFDRADYGTETASPDETTSPSVLCATCQKSIADSYYKINYEMVCKTCHNRILAAREQGSGFGRFVRALALGLGAGAVGFGIYYGILRLTNYEFGLIAILVGFMVGMAVKAGSNHRGGWVYQTLAIVITYASIVSTYVPFVMEGMFEGMNAPTAAEAESDTGEALAVSEETSGAESAPLRREDLNTFQWILFLGIAFVLSLAAPVLAGFENILGMLIIGFGLYQAWKMNQRVPFETEGPFQVGAAFA